jgi:Primase X
MLEEKLAPTSQNILAGLDFILSHFQERVFPRTVSTWSTENRQVEVFDKETGTNIFENSKFIDCRINAFPTYTQYKGINRQTPNFIFIDLDRSLFNSEKALNIVLNNTLKNIKEKLNGAHPTVLWSGNGYHIYLPINGFVLEEIDIFNKFENPSNRFLKFAELYLSNGKADLSHTPSFKSCMIRIPNSQNSKCIAAGTNPEVEIIQRWDGYRPEIRLLLGSFYAYLVYQQIKEKEKSLRKYQNNPQNSNPTTLVWIEKLLQTPIEDYRKNAISLILAPYLINIRGLPYQNASNIIEEWLNKCDAIRKLDRNIRFRKRYALNTSIRKRIPPLRLETLKLKNNWLYNKLVA